MADLPSAGGKAGEKSHRKEEPTDSERLLLGPFVLRGDPPSGDRSLDRFSDRVPSEPGKEALPDCGDSRDLFSGGNHDRDRILLPGAVFFEQ